MWTVRGQPGRRLGVDETPAMIRSNRQGGVDATVRCDKRQAQGAASFDWLGGFRRDLMLMSRPRLVVLLASEVVRVSLGLGGRAAGMIEEPKPDEDRVVSWLPWSLLPASATAKASSALFLSFASSLRR